MVKTYLAAWRVSERLCQTLLSDGSADASGLGSGIGCQTLLLDGSEEALDLGSGIGYCIYAQAVAMVRTSGGAVTQMVTQVLEIVLYIMAHALL